jgi:NAD(P)-dependent dehydrogenase (short-subunit alcohol dehydrogenase family)
VALALSQQGARVVVTSRTPTELDETLRQLQGGADSAAYACDVSNADQVGYLTARVVQRFGRLDILVNAAAILGPIGPLWQCDLEQWRSTLVNNLCGTAYCCHAAIPYMLKGGHGRIINFAGGGATSPRPNVSAYAVAKTGIVRLTETLAEELKPYGVTVNAIAPGLVNTRMLDALEDAGTDAAEAESMLVKKLRRSGKGESPPELAAGLAVFLASKEARFLTGRLISAPHDDWRSWDENRISEIALTSWLTLRRMDLHTLEQLDRRVLSS